MQLAHCMPIVQRVPNYKIWLRNSLVYLFGTYNFSMDEGHRICHRNIVFEPFISNIYKYSIITRHSIDIPYMNI